MNAATNFAIDWSERGLLPDYVVRRGIRALLRDRLAEIDADDCESMSERAADFIAAMNEACVAPLPELANEQHYELPAEFFAEVLGRRRKYSCCFFDDGVSSLDTAEERALALSCVRAQIDDGMRILELGCGWGSLTLWMAERFPGSRITAVSNSRSQRAHIVAEATRRGLDNVEIVTADMNDFATAETFDRVVSIEMFEHMRNYRELFRRVHGWLRPRGLFFMHIFCHRSTVYEFADGGPRDWMSRHFFSGGIMPSEDLPLRFQEHLKLRRTWRWDGRHYQRTADAWLQNMDRRRERVLPILARTYGVDQAARWCSRWRIFFMACAELFGHERGQQWWVSHYLFERGGRAA